MTLAAGVHMAKKELEDLPNREQKAISPHYVVNSRSSYRGVGTSNIV